MRELVEFLRARIIERETRARRFHPAEALHVHFSGDAEPTALYTAADVLTECSAQREIAEGWGDFLEGAPPWAERDVPSLLAMARRTLSLLALPYADHPDYREEWRP